MDDANFADDSLPELSSEPDPLDEGRPNDVSLEDSEAPERPEPGSLGFEPSSELTPDRPRGIDVSVYQRKIDWKAVAAAGVRFAYIRLSYSNALDIRGASNWDGARGAGVICGGYHFFRWTRPVEEQVATFLRIFSKTRPYRPALPPALDLEWDKYAPLKSAADRAALVRGALAWSKGVEAEIGTRPIIYTGPNFWKELGDPKDLAQYGLWVARINVPKPKLPPPWTDHVFWQYSDTGSVPGISGKVDLDLFNGTLQDLAAASGS